MQSEYAEAEELLIAVAVGLSLERPDLVVRAFQRPGRDGHVVVGQYSISIDIRGVGHLPHLTDTRGPGSGDPIPQKACRTFLVRQAP